MESLEPHVLAGILGVLQSRGIREADAETLLRLEPVGGAFVLKHPDHPSYQYWPRVWAARAFLYGWDEAAAEPLLQALTDPHWRVREMAAKALGKNRVSDAVDPLCEALADPHWRVRKAAAVALGRVGDAGAKPALQQAFWDGHEAVQKSAARALNILDKRLSPAGLSRWPSRRG